MAGNSIKNKKKYNALEAQGHVQGTRREDRQLWQGIQPEGRPQLRQEAQVRASRPRRRDRITFDGDTPQCEAQVRASAPRRREWPCRPRRQRVLTRV